MAYVLNPAHPRGRDEARVFNSGLGYDRTSCAGLVDRPARAYLVDFSGGSAEAADFRLPVVALKADQLTRICPRRPT